MSHISAKRDFCVREKLLTNGAPNLSDAELLSVFISSGSAKRSCVQLADDLLEHLGDFRNILNAELNSFEQVPGLGVVRYVQLQAVREMCRRSDFIHLQKNVTLSSTKQAYAYIKRYLRDKHNETFAALFLDSQNKVLAFEELFTGTINAAAVYPRPIIKRVLKHNAASVILAHNHPSGLSDASKNDIAVTKRIEKALELIDVRLLDHLVVGDNEIYSIHHKTKSPCY